MKKAIIVILLAVFAFPQLLEAKLRHVTYEEALKESDVIAVIEVTSSARQEESGVSMYYFNFLVVLKGKVEKKENAIIQAQHDFACVEGFKFEKGKYLVFLKKSGDNIWQSLNFQTTVFNIEESSNGKEKLKYWFHQDENDNVKPKNKEIELEALIEFLRQDLKTLDAGKKNK